MKQQPKLPGLLKVMQQKVEMQREQQLREQDARLKFEAKVITMTPRELKIAAKNYNQSA